jgi:transcription-repair coupling factor (superfamily II helicase)
VSYSAPDERFKAFEEAFPYTETPDQLRAVERIIKEMCAPKPMDHLLCGDVGFGKTEVAMRAAMKALLDGKQVALLAPTTILASQHTKTFRERFKGTPFKIEQLSRFVSAERKRDVIEGLSTGDVHLVIGTQSLLQDRVVIPELGLLILDEEHRFGVKDKEKLKRFKAELDVLSMTATPIPRTLHLSLNGLRSMSILSTPPRDRLSVYTQLSRLSPSLVREASLAELRRGGQVFYVYNRVETIETKRAWLQTLLPSATIDVAHGKMRPEELEEVMQRFVEGRSQVLVCTTLIETGIDIPRANTMFIDKAHTFGLAQLYQLRGRVGRSHERARCYLLVPAEDLISDIARERLKVLSRFTELGSGFHIASHDLELRGAGDLLGVKQNGQSQQVGLELYHELLQEAISRQQGHRLSHRFEPELKLPYTEREVLPSDYIESSRVRLTTYRRLAQCRTLASLEPIVEELRDRFGAPPPHAEATLTRWRALIIARELGVELISYERGALTLQLHADSPFPHSAMPPVMRALGAGHFTDLKDGIWRYQPHLKERSDLIYALATWLTHMHDQLLISPVTPTRSTS